MTGLNAVNPGVLCRNLNVSGSNLGESPGKRVQIGAVVRELTVPCHPCSKMETVLGEGGYTAMRGHGGMCASLITEGRVAAGDAVIPV